MIPLNKILLALAVLCLATSSKATIYNATNDFSIGANPNSVWTYGFTDASGGSFAPYSAASASWHGAAGLSAWSQFDPDSDSDAYSVVGKNVTGGGIVTGGSISVDSGALFAHPNYNNQKAAIRFDVPGNGVVDINAVFEAADTSGGSRDVHVFLNGSELYGALLNGAKANSVTATGVTGIPVIASDFIYFLVGSNGDYSNDATQLAISVNFIPEPTSLTLIGLGAVALFSVRRRMRSA